MPDINFKLHPKQLEVLKNPARFKVVAAGRRFGKSYLARIIMLIEALKLENESGYDLKGEEVWIVTPTFQQGKDIHWQALKDIAREVTAATIENTASLTLTNGRKIQIKGSDRPDTLRGAGLSYVVMDEFAFMKPEVWEMIISPTLTKVKGGALFIGTPDGKNHFFDLYSEAADGSAGPDWAAFNFSSFDNPLLPEEEIEAKRQKMSIEAFNQEFKASFVSGGNGFFKPDQIQYYDVAPQEGFTFIAVDPAGFVETEAMLKSQAKRLDECAIAVVRVCPQGWYVEDIISGRWGIRET